MNERNFIEQLSNITDKLSEIDKAVFYFKLPKTDIEYFFNLGFIFDINTNILKYDLKYKNIEILLSLHNVNDKDNKGIRLYLKIPENKYELQINEFYNVKNIIYPIRILISLNNILTDKNNFYYKLFNLFSNINICYDRKLNNLENTFEVDNILFNNENGYTIKYIYKTYFSVYDKTKHISNCDFEILKLYEIEKLNIFFENKLIN